MAKEAWVTLATNDSYAVGVLVLAHSLQSVETSRPLAVMVSEEVSSSMRNRLSEVCSKVVEVNVLDSGDSAHLALLARPELGITFTKLHCWTLTDYDKCVFLDADTLVIRNCDELFDREELSAAPDAGWPDCFNSGVFVFRPSQETYSKLLEFAVNQGSFDGGDQGLLNSYFSDWATKDISRHLPFIYNMTATSVYSYKPAYNQFSKEVRIVHFAGSPKPWQIHDVLSLTPPSSEHMALWWNMFCRHVSPLLSSDMEKTRGLRIATCPVVSVIQASRVYDDNSSSDADMILSSKQPHRQFKVEMEEERSVSTLHVQPTNQPFVSYEAVEPPPIEIVAASFDPSPAFIETTLLIDEGVPPEPEIPSTGQGFDWFACDTTTTAEKEDYPSQTAPEEVSTGMAAQLAELKLEEAAEVELTPEEQSEIETRRHREAWERGEIDYKGRDAFDNIWSKIDKTLRGASSSNLF